MNRSTRLPRALAGALAATSVAAHAASAVFVTPGTPYLSSADIPAGFYGGGAPMLLDTLESGQLHPSLVASQGGLLIDTFGGARDSVDADDGVIDGTCGPQNGRRCASWFHSDGAAGVTFTYVGSGPAPTAFGLVWTDGSGSVTFSAVGVNGQNLGSVTRSGFADNSFSATTAEDHFFGVQFAGGIRSITISNSAGGIEVDHLQYGQMTAAVPEPSTWALMAAGLLGVGGLARRRGATAR